MTELIVFGDAEALTIQYLKSVVTGPRISSEVPDPLTGSLVTIQRVGGAEQNLVTDAPLLIIQAWAQNKADAWDLIALVRAHIRAMPGNTLSGTWVYKTTEASGPAYFPDPETKDYARYQMTVQLRTRGNTI